MFDRTYPTVFVLWALLTVLSTCGLLVAEKYGFSRLRAVFKVVAAVGFFGAAATQNPLRNDFTMWITIGLGLSVAGDVCLISKTSKRLFLIGIGAFLMAHTAYIRAFFINGVDGNTMALAGIVMSSMAWIIYRWLHTDIPTTLKTPVMAYLLVISFMMTSAVGAWRSEPGMGISVVAAALFVASDIGVAIQRFKTDRFAHKLWALPTYFIAQLMFASQVVQHA